MFKEYCDICGNEMKSNKKEASLSFYGIRKISNYKSICSNCSEELSVFVKSLIIKMSKKLVKSK